MTSTALEFGLINTFRTGHVLLDALVCMLVPLLIQRITEKYSFTGVWCTIKTWILGDGDDREVTRQIQVKQRFNEYGLVWDGEQRSLMLQKAVAAHLAKILDLRGKSAKVELVEKQNAKSVDGDGDAASASDTSCSSASDDSDDGYESDDYDYETRVYRGEVYRLKPNVLPPLDDWIEVEPGVEFIHEAARTAGDNKEAKVAETTTTYTFRSSLPDASKRIDGIVHAAFAKYQARERRRYKDDATRFLYIQSGTKEFKPDDEDGDGAGEVVMAYKRYALGEEKSFDNLFFKDKSMVLKLLDDFTHKAGKFAIRGFPYKLGLLLHGPPGTGKTSLIKAIAQHTKRHIVTINLSKIKTNQELMDAVFDLKFAVDGQDWPVQMGFKDVVFVMEDVDCASNVVASRQAPSLVKTKTRSDGQALTGQTASNGGLPPLMPLKPLSSALTTDKLNLSGLLNVLDGVVDCPGRVVILTTNHPEKLDPALIRPGRVNKQLLLDYMGAAEMREMIEYYTLAKLTTAQREQLHATVSAATAKRLTPAEVEECCAEFDDVDSALYAVQRAANGEAPTAWGV